MWQWCWVGNATTLAMGNGMSFSESKPHVVFQFVKVTCYYFQFIARPTPRPGSYGMLLYQIY